MRILSPTGHLGFTPIERGSFDIGVSQRPDAIVADSGSCDIGPQPLGADEHCSPDEWQRHDLELMLLAARQLGVPMIVGSASDAGTDRGVHQYAEIIRELARRHGLAPFNLATIFSEVSRDEVARRLRSGVRVEGLDGRPDLTQEVLARTDRLVAVMGVEPIIQALDQGADVVIAGRAGDSCLFAAPAIRAGFPEAAAYYLGKVLECASFAGEPFMGKESIIGTVTPDAVSVTAMHPGQRCTVASVASHAMYERASPFFEHVAGGVLDMTHCRYEQVDERTTRVSGFAFRRDAVYRIKLEGSGKSASARCPSPGSATRTPSATSMPSSAGRARRCRSAGAAGRALSALLPRLRARRRHGPVGASARRARARAVPGGRGRRAALGGRRGHLRAGHAEPLLRAAPRGQGTAGTAALMMDEVLRGKPGYEWTVNHVLPLADPLELTTVKLEVVGR